jgi:transcriptional regulator with XRE-family HTH domain
MSRNNYHKVKIDTMTQENNLLDVVRDALHDRIIERVAERTGLSKTTIHAVAKGQYKKAPHTSTLRTLADYLKVGGCANG